MNFSAFKRQFSLLLLILALFVFAYWFKYQLGINFFDSLSISAYPPFSYLTNHTIKSPIPGTVFEDNFEKKGIFSLWSHLWTRESETATIGFAQDGINDSRCLLIRNTGTGSWVYSHKKSVEVKKGDIFYFGGFVNIRGADAFAYLSVAAFDKHKKAVSWNFFKEKITDTDEWIKVQQQFEIPDNIGYIRFRLAGVGIGEYRFDDIIFRKIK